MVSYLVMALYSVKPANQNFKDFLTLRKKNFIFFDLQVIGDKHWILNGIASTIAVGLSVYSNLLSHTPGFLLSNIICVTAYQIGKEYSEILRNHQNLELFEVGVK